MNFYHYQKSLFYLFTSILFINLFFSLSPVCVAAQQKSISIIAFKNDSGHRELEQLFTNDLISKLSESPGITLVDRSNIKEMLNEQSLGRTGLISQNNAAVTGHMDGIDYLLTGTILSVQNTLQKNQRSPAAQFTIFWKLLDTTSGKIIVADTSVSSIKKTLIKQNGKKIWMTTSQDTNTAIQKITNNISQTIQSRLNIPDLEVHIANVDHSTIYLDKGAKDKISPGQIFIVCKEGALIRHPVTGIVLGRQRNFLCQILIENVEDNLASGTVLRGSAENVHIGDIAIRK
jgi:TolB-like protein